MTLIFFAAGITTLISLLVLWGMVSFGTKPKARIFLLVIFLLYLPLSAFVFQGIIVPFNIWLRGLVYENHGGLYYVLATFYAPVFQEIAKLWLFVLPWFFKRINEKNYVITALAIGFGFGTGETWFLALKAQHAGMLPLTLLTPWYKMVGFAGERIMVCLQQGIFTAVALRSVTFFFSKTQENSRWLTAAFIVQGIIGAMVFHYLGDLPGHFRRMDFLLLGKHTWGQIFSFWHIFYFLEMLFLLGFLVLEKSKKIEKVLTAKTRCPECFLVYEREPWAIVNFFSVRYERCPGCKKLHWTMTWKEGNKICPCSSTG